MKNLERRDFLKVSAIGGIGMLGYKMVKANDLTKYSAETEIEEATILELQEMMKSGKLTSKDLTQKYIDRIKEIDGKISSVIELNPDALKIAEDLDKERQKGKLRSSMHGIPVLLKDNIDTADQMRTTAGSLALLDAPAPKQDAFIVAQLRKAGAVILGKTNLSEWANFRSESSSSGWSGRGGQTRNPYILDRTPCGSSSGSGVAVAANLTSVAVGTETDGSVVCPSSINGVVGIKPTLGLVSRSGIIPIAASQDTAGPMARTVTDAAILLGVMVGEDKRDTITSQAKTKGLADYTKGLSSAALKGSRIGVIRQYFGKNAKVDEVMEQSIRSMKGLGASFVDVTLPTLREFGDAEFEVLLFEFKAGLNKYLAERGGKHKTLQDLIEFNEANKEKEMPYFGQDIFIKAQQKGDLEDRQYRLALLQSKVLTQDKGIDAIMDKDKLDALIAPSNAQAWMIDLINGDSPTNYVSSSSMPAVSGYPNITVPAGFISEMPIGISFWGKAFTEEKLIKLAYSFEQLTKARQKPKFIPTYT